MTPSIFTKGGRPHESTHGNLIDLRRIEHKEISGRSFRVRRLRLGRRDERRLGGVRGDLRCHGRHGDSTWDFAKEAAKLNPAVLIIEGTRIDSEDTLTEDQVRTRRSTR